MSLNNNNNQIPNDELNDGHNYPDYMQNPIPLPPLNVR